VNKLLRGRFWGFSPHRGDRLHRLGRNLARRSGPKVHSSTPRMCEGVDQRSTPLRQISPHRCNDTYRTQNCNLYWDFTKIFAI